jgi:hypothetical protein
LKEEVLSMDDLWDEISDEGFQAVSGKRWLYALDALHDKILDSIWYSWIADPYFMTGATEGRTKGSRIESKASSPTAWPFKVSASVGPRVIPLTGILTLQ